MPNSSFNDRTIVQVDSGYKDETGELYSTPRERASEDISVRGDSD